MAVALVVAHLTVRSLRPDNPTAALRVHQGLLSWDAGWYRAIADHGYAAAGRQALRFFPLFPMAGRYLGRVPGVGTGVALVAVSNAAALLALAALLLLVRHDLGDADLARRSVWLLALAPSAYSMVLAYSDALLLLCSVVTFLGIRTGRWWWAAAAGLAAGADRPVGVLLTVPVALELWSRRHSLTSAGRRLAGGVALVAPAVGAGAFLAWTDHAFGDAWLPLDRPAAGRAPGTGDRPARRHGSRRPGRPPRPPPGQRPPPPWVAVCAVLAVVAWRRLPRSYALYATVVLVASLSSTNMDSFERYALAAFPLVIAASTATTRRPVEVAVLVVSAGAMTAYAAVGLPRDRRPLTATGSSGASLRRAPRGRNYPALRRGQPKPARPTGRAGTRGRRGSVGPPDVPGPERPAPARPATTAGAAAGTSRNGPHRMAPPDNPETAGDARRTEGAVDPVVVIGGGPAGLTAAYRLAQAGDPVVVLEQDSVLGGISRTVERDGWRFDIGGHRFFTKVVPVEEFWHEILPEEDFLLRPRMSRIFYGGKYYDYPIKLGNALSNLGIMEAVRCGLSFLWVRVRPPRDQSTLEGYIVSNYGWRLYQHFFKTYNEKVWGVPASELSADWGAQRIKGMSLWDAVWEPIRSSFGRRRDRSKQVTSLIEEFQYPKYGPGMMWERCAEQVADLGGEVRMQTSATTVHVEDGRATAVTVDHGGTTERVDVEPRDQLHALHRPGPGGRPARCPTRSCGPLTTSTTATS